MALLSFAPLFLAQPAHASCVDSYQSQVIAAAELASESTEAVVRTIETCGGDDTSYQVPLTTTVMFDGVEYSSVYATTNSVITFGRPDGTYWTYPSTPSISMYSFDWVVYPGWRSDEHLIIRSSDGGFQVDISARPIWLQNATDPTHIVITAAILSDGTVAMAYTLNGPEYPEYNPRTGVRLNSGEIVDFETYGIQETEEAPELAPEPTEEAPFNPPASETSTRTEEVDRTPPFVPEGASIVQEGSTFDVVAPEGQRIANVVGYYGDPNDSTRGGEVSSILFELLAGETSATVEISNELFGNDPAPGTPKVLIFLIVYEDIPIESAPVAPAPEPAPVAPEPSPEPEPTPESPVEPVEPLEPEIEESPQPEPVEPPTSPTEPEISPEVPAQPNEEFNSPLAAVGEAIAESFEAAVEAISEAVEALQTAGLDMTEEERKQAQSVVIPSVMVALVATSSVIRK